MSKEFHSKVHLIKEADLEKFLAPGYEEYLPDEMSTGKADTTAMVKDFIKYRLYREIVPSTSSRSLSTHKRRHHHQPIKTVSLRSLLSLTNEDTTSAEQEDMPDKVKKGNKKKIFGSWSQKWKKFTAQSA